MAWTPMRLRFRSGAIIFDGEAEGAGGGSPPVFMYGDSGDPLTINDSTSAPLPWTFSGINGDAALLDLTDPTTPVIKEAGVYAITVEVGSATYLPEGTAFTVALNLDIDGVTTDSAGFNSASPPASAGSGARPFAEFPVVIAVTFPYLVGQRLQVVVGNFHTGQANDFALDNVMVTKLS